jgi:hypothetical protein
MLKEAIDRILSLSAPTIWQDLTGRQYSDRALFPVKDPMTGTKTTATLTGFVDLLNAGINEFVPANCYIHVEDPRTVELYELKPNRWGDRQMHIAAKLPDYGRFAFNTYMDPETFIIGLQTFFHSTPGDDIENILKIVGNLKAEQVQEANDDGVTQRVATRSGVVIAKEVEVKRLVRLYPYRTFREIVQPPSNFVFRLKNQREGGIPSPGLWLADGEVWQQEAMERIKTWLKPLVRSIPVVA